MIPGFAPVTRWQFGPTGRLTVQTEPKWPDRSGWLYAFVADDSIKYIGKTIVLLRARMANYAYSDGDTNVRLRRLIGDIVRQGQDVFIYGRMEEDPSLLRTEEGRLIADFRPPWNRTRQGIRP